MKQTVKYICVVAATVLVVAMSVLLPPYFAARQDDAFLGVVKLDETQSESFQYKATKYQKTKVLYEALVQQYGPWDEIESAAQEIADSEKYGSSVEWEYTEHIPQDAVMTKGKAENAVAREARKLQSTGALPKFDLGKDGDYSAVSGIAFLTVTDLSAANAKFYFWEGRIDNEQTGDSYRFVIDDELGKVYYMNIDYKQASKISIVRTDREQEIREMATSFAQYHELGLGAQRRMESAEYGRETQITAEYFAADRDFVVFGRLIKGEYRTEKNMVDWYGSYIMLLKPADPS